MRRRSITCLRGFVRLVAVPLTVTLWSCDDLLVEVEARQALEPPHLYVEWWDQLQRCAGVTGGFETIEWWTGEAIAIDGADKVGVWLAPNTIILESFYVTSEPAVKHEMLHHLTRGEMPHSAPEFTRCTATRTARGTIHLGPRPRPRN